MIFKSLNIFLCTYRLNQDFLEYLLGNSRDQNGNNVVVGLMLLSYSDLLGIQKKFFPELFKTF